MSLQVRLEALVTAIGADIKQLYSQVSGGGTTTVIDGGATPGEANTGVTVSSGGAVMPTLVDAKGDILAATAADTVANLPVGLTDQVLTVDPASSVGISWKAPAVSASQLTATGTRDASTFLRGDNTWAPSSTVYKKTANQSLTTTAVVNVTDLAFPIAANATAEFELMLALTSAATTTGWLFGFTGPAGVTSFVATQEYQSSATAWATSTLQALGNFTLITAAYVATPSAIVSRIKGVIQNGANAGIVQFMGGTEIANSAIVIRAGSTLKVA